jgi:hypothetical protein
MTEMGLLPVLSVVRVCTDSSVAKSLVAARGVGKMRHIEVKLLWLQEQVRHQRLKVCKGQGHGKYCRCLDQVPCLAKADRAVGAARCTCGGPVGGDRRTEGGC